MFRSFYRAGYICIVNFRYRVVPFLRGWAPFYPFSSILGIAYFFRPATLYLQCFRLLTFHACRKSSFTLCSTLFCQSSLWGTSSFARIHARLTGCYHPWFSSPILGRENHICHVSAVPARTRAVKVVFHRVFGIFCYYPCSLTLSKLVISYLQYFRFSNSLAYIKKKNYYA